MSLAIAFANSSHILLVIGTIAEQASGADGVKIAVLRKGRASSDFI